MSKRTYVVLLVVVMIAAAFVDQLLKPVLSVWLRVPLLSLIVAVAVLVIILVYQRKNNQGT